METLPSGTKGHRSLDTYLPAAIRSSPALVAQARTPRTGPMSASAAPALVDDFSLDGGSAGPGSGNAPSSRQATPPAVDLPAPQSPPRKAETVTYTMGTLTGCDGLGAIDGSVPLRRPPHVLELSSPAGK
jgi:hypothetical protein